MALRPDPKQPLDALILVPPGPLSDFAEDLGAELVRLGQRMQVRSVCSHAESPIKLDKAMAATQDAATRSAVGEARTALAAILTLNGVVISGGSKARGASVNGGAKRDAERSGSLGPSGPRPTSRS
jgi:hypothetical protein